MRARRGLAAAVAMFCVMAALFNGGVSADADDDPTIDVDAAAVTAGADGKCSLVEAITNVSGHNRVWADCPSGAGITRIHLVAATYTLTAALPEIHQSVEIDGDGADTTIIDGASAYPLLKAVGGGWLTVDGLTFRNGKSGQGGAIAASNEAGTMNLTVRNSSFEHNATSSGEGGAIYLDGGTLTVTGSSFIGNVAKRDGGAIGLGPNFNYVPATVANSTFVDNTGKSGGVFAVHDGGHNDAVTVVNSTFSGNDATTKNTGIASNIETVTLKNTIVAKGAAKQPVCATGEIAYASASGHNLTDDASCSTRFFTVVTAVDLGAIGLHGGATANFEPPAGSAAIDAGDDTTCGASPVNGNDQRGFTRVAQGTHCDIGAVEVQVAAEPTRGALVRASKSVAGTAAPGGTITYTVILSNSGEGAQGDNTGHEFADTLPAGLRLNSAVASSGTAIADSDAGMVTWDGQIAAGGSVTVTIVATVTGAVGETISNQASASYDSDGDDANDASVLSDDPATSDVGDATTFVVTGPDIHVLKTTTMSGPYEPGDTIGYRVVISNEGNANATGVTLHDVLDPNTTLDAASIDISHGTPGATDGHTLAVDVDEIVAGGEVVVTFDVAVSSAVPAGTTDVQNQAIVSGTNFDDVASDDDGDGTNGVNPTLSQLQTTRGLDIDIGAVPAATPGEVVTYALGYLNVGDIGLDQVMIAADVPVGAQFDEEHSTSGWLCTTPGDQPVCELEVGVLNGGASGTVWFAVSVDAGITADSMSLAVSISSGATVAGTTTTTAIVRPDISAAIGGPATANPGGSATYKVTVTNSGTAAAEHVQVTSTLPGLLTFAGGEDCSARGQDVECDLGELAAGGTATVTIYSMVTASALDQTKLSVGGSVSWISAAAPALTNVVSTTIEAVDLTAFVEGTVEAAPGDTVVLDVIYANRGSATATGVWIGASLPSGVSIVPEKSPGWDCTGSDCYLPFGILAPGSGSTPLGVYLGDVLTDTTSLTIAISIGNDGGHGPDANAIDNITAALISIVRPDLGVALSAPATTTPGGAVTYNVTVTNLGGAPAASTLLTDELPAGLTFDASVTSVGCQAKDGVVSCAVPALGAGDSASVTIGALVAGGLADGQALSNQGFVGPVFGEAAIENNSSNDAQTVVHAADLGLTGLGGGTARPGRDTAYRFVLSNEGSLAANGVSLMVTLSDGLTFLPPDAPDGCSSAGQSVTCTAPDAIEPGATVSFSIGAEVSSEVADGAQLISSASATSATPESTATLADNAAQVTTTVTYVVAVEAQLAGPSVATTSDMLSYTLTVTNSGDRASTEFNIAADAGLAIESVSPNGDLTCARVSPGKFACSGTMPAKSAELVTVNAHLDGSVFDAGVGVAVSGRAFTGDSAAPVHDQGFGARASTSALRVVSMAVRASASPGVVTPGNDITFTVTASNMSDAVEGLLLTIALPAGVEYRGVTTEGGIGCVGEDVVRCVPAGGPWPRGAVANVTVSGRVTLDAAPGRALEASVTLGYPGGTTGATAAAVVAMPPPDFVIPLEPVPGIPGAETYTYTLKFRWTLITWVGPNGESPGEAISLGGDQVVAIRAIYAWDAITGAWRGYFGDAAPVPVANDLEGMEYGRVYWVAIEGASSAGWTVPLGAAGG